MNGQDVTLAISTSGDPEIAVVEGQIVVTQTSSKPALEALVGLVEGGLSQAKLRIDDVTLVGVCTGPGSFTGLRIGVAFAKSLAQTREIAIVGVSTYDINAFYAHSYPVVSVARGKPNYYYAKVMASKTDAPLFVQGSHEIIEHAAMQIATTASAPKIVGPDFSPLRPGDAAKALAELAKQAREGGQDSHWTNIAIDYGQRPNAVVNWERRHRAQAEGPPLSRRESFPE